jgi:hypothetical protein
METQRKPGVRQTKNNNYRYWFFPKSLLLFSVYLCVSVSLWQMFKVCCLLGVSSAPLLEQVDDQQYDER